MAARVESRRADDAAAKGHRRSQPATAPPRRHNRRVNAVADQLALFGEPAARASRRCRAGWAYRLDFIDAEEERALLALIATLPLAGSPLQGLHRAPPRRPFRHRVRLRRQPRCCPARRCRPASSRCAPRPRRGSARRPTRWPTRSSPSTGRAFRSAGTATCPTTRPSSASRSPAPRGCAFAAIRRCSRRRPTCVSLELAPRSAYVLRAEARWGWQHSVAPTPALRYSITFRTRSQRRSPPASRSAGG